MEKFDIYQDLTKQTAVYPGAGNSTNEGLSYLFLKLVGEAGECAEKMGKLLRDGTDHPEAWKYQMKKELGDVLWYIARASDELGFKMSDVAETNIQKLILRKQKGTLHGSGDDR